MRSQPHGGTLLGKAVEASNLKSHDRLTVIAGEQCHDALPAPAALRAYLIDSASNRNRIG